ncbi:hypothetical protein [Leptolyngbya ohadii]|uniref:hypothetical protein n=1 Tax=Leptolyngbya ohadii TaxID=1962290 RepID=UPI00117AE83C|nr:hypothetical protein [Leptolyngbya ohadii]
MVLTLNTYFTTVPAGTAPSVNEPHQNPIAPTAASTCCSAGWTSCLESVECDLRIPDDNGKPSASAWKLLAQAEAEL